MSAPSSDSAAIRQVIRALKDSGHTLIEVDDGGDITPVSGEQEAIDAITAVDAAALHVSLPDRQRGWLYFVLGNDPEEVVADFTTNLPVVDALTRGWWE